MMIKTKQVFKMIIKNISEKYEIKLTKKQENDIWYAIKNQIPILFLGEVMTGKTVLAKALQEFEVTAYAPEMISAILLGAGNQKEKREITRLTQLYTQS